MIIRSKAPLRIGLAGGGTDVSPYCDRFGGAILNVTIDMYAYCTIEPTDNQSVVFNATDIEQKIQVNSPSQFELENELILHKAVYNRIVRQYNNGEALSFIMTTYSDAPPGSGLGSSSTMVVTMIKAYMEWLNLPLGDYDIASLAYDIERNEANLSGGKQDQYAATFGGLNFMEFYDHNKIVVNPLRIKRWIKNEIESSLVLYYTGKSRDSSQIIDHQKKSTTSNDDRLEGMHKLKEYSFLMKEAILKAEFELIATYLNESWNAKKRTSTAITNSYIDTLYDYAIEHGGKAAKISGAGGGGFMLIICDPKRRCELVRSLEKLGGKVMLATFTEKGAQAWTLYE